MVALYRKEIIERYRFPHHRGEIENADLQGEVMNNLCGDEITLFVKFDVGKEKVAEVKFSGEGCALMTASADILCSALLGKNKKDLAKFSERDLMSWYGEKPTPARTRCVLLPLEALRSGFKMMSF